MHSEPRLKTIRSRPLKSINVERNSITVAGYSEFVSKRLSIGKLLSTLIHQSALDLDHSVTTILAAVSHPEQAVNAEFSGAISDFRRFSACTQHVSAMLDLISFEVDDALLICAGPSASYARLAHEDLTRSLKTHSQRYEAELAELIVGWEDLPAKTYHSTAKKIIVEDKPGKPYLLMVEDSTLRQALRKWQQVVRSGSAGIYPSDIVEGWAAMATVIKGGVQPESNRKLRITSVDVYCENDVIDLRQLRNLIDFAETWLASVAMVQLSELRSISLNLPSAAITGFVRRELLLRCPTLVRARFEISPFALGWHPIRSLFESIVLRDIPGFFINTADYPVVNLVACCV